MSRFGLSVGTLSVMWFTFLQSPSFAWIQKECETNVPQPTNLTLLTTKPGQYKLTWHWNRVKELWNSRVKYLIETQMGPTSDWTATGERSMRLSERIALHKGISLRVRAKINETCTGNVSEEIHYTPEGVNGTVAENVLCVAYNTSSMNCTWIAGLKAPEDTRYNLTLMQEELVEKCHLYQQDSLGRDISCRFHNLKIHLDDDTYILIEGQSKEAQIQFYDQWFIPFETEVLNPPSDIKVQINAQNLIVQWEKPQTSYQTQDYCFTYEMSIQEKMYTTAFNEKSFTLPIHSFKEGEKYNLKIRARGYKCRFGSEWGAWSGPIIISVPAQGYWYTLAVILGIISGSVLLSLLLVCLCTRLKLKQKIWPPIPKPKESLCDFEEQFINITEVKCEVNSSVPQGRNTQQPNDN